MKKNTPQQQLEKIEKIKEKYFHQLDGLRIKRDKKIKEILNNIELRKLRTEFKNSKKKI